ncbi:MAG: FkbM family methyltransferase [Chlorobi bacterium]|nr:FkbM family methyltransferase [Chlorobiota bacterium]
MINNVSKKLKSIIKIIFFNKIIKLFFNSVFIHKFSINYFNFIYENCSDFFVEIFVKLINQPKFNYLWTIYLKNKRKVLVEVRTDNPRSFEYSLSYKWHDRPLRDVEIIFNNYYPRHYYYLDIGANYGLRSIYALSIGRPVILFEPNCSINNFTTQIFKINNFNNFKLENLCISDKTGEVEFYLSENTYESSLYKFDYAIKKIKVSSITLDEYFSGLINEIIPRIIKIDVEGAEYEVFKGAEKTIVKYEPTLFIEILKDSTTRNQLMSELFKLKYKCVALKNGLFKNFINLNQSNFEEMSQYCTNYLFTKDSDALKKIKLHDLS